MFGSREVQGVQMWLIDENARSLFKIHLIWNNLKTMYIIFVLTDHSVHCAFCWFLTNELFSPRLTYGCTVVENKGYYHVPGTQWNRWFTDSMLLSFHKGCIKMNLQEMEFIWLRLGCSGRVLKTWQWSLGLLRGGYSGFINSRRVFDGVVIKCWFWWINFCDVDVESAGATWSTSRQNHPACTAPTVMKLTICHRMGISGSTRSWSVHLMTLNCCHGQLEQRARVTLFAPTVSIIHPFGKAGNRQRFSVTTQLHAFCSHLFITLLSAYCAVCTEAVFNYFSI
jgi:hypothetical protein